MGLGTPKCALAILHPGFCWGLGGSERIWGGFEGFWGSIKEFGGL